MMRLSARKSSTHSEEKRAKMGLLTQNKDVAAPRIIDSSDLRMNPEIYI